MLTVSVYRYNPEIDYEPYMQDFSFDDEGKDMMVLDVLEKLKVIDPTLVFRRSCREGVCGSDGVNISGKNGLACITPLSEAVRDNKLVIRPLPGLPVVRDLVIDMTQFYAQYEKIKPYMMNDSVPPEKERLQSQEDRAKLDGYTSAYCVLVAPPHVHLSGGILTSSLDHLDFFKHIDSWRIAETQERKRDLLIFRIRLVFLDVMG